MAEKTTGLYVRMNPEKKEKAEAIVNETAHRIQKMAVSSYKRFFGNVKDDFYADEVDKILHFFNNRSKYMLHYTDEMIK